jgi:exodeoxyribonuclease V gamma subunit
MPLSISYVRSLDEVIDAAAIFLSREGDLFVPQRIVVPTAGAKAWLVAELAKRLGAKKANGSSGGDGIVANVVFSYPGTISALISADTRPPDDPWEVERLAFTILEVLAKEDAGKQALRQIVQRAGGPLLAARRIADRFDHYHFRRSGMILEWETGKPNLSPEANAAGSRVERPLSQRDRWQFDLWREVRQVIAEPSPPARERTAEGPAPEAVLVAGLQGLSLHQIALLERLAEMPTTAGQGCDVEVLLVHPSSRLRQVWVEQSPPVSKDLAPARGEPQLTNTDDPLVEAWLRGTRESQWLLASQGLSVSHRDSAPSPTTTAKTTLLAQMQKTVASGEQPQADAGHQNFSNADQSVRIHRCHDLSRQAEVLHEAILHAFRELPDLAPHEVVILSPQIAKLAPHLEAVFNREVTGAEQAGQNAQLQLPLLVADRGIREVSPGAELLAAIIELAGSRCSVDAMLTVATHPLVLTHYGCDEGTIDSWQQCIERTKIRWGFDAARRRRGGLDCDNLPAHTWRLGLERMLLGAVMPDGDPEPVLGDVVPLRSVATADIQSLAPLITIVGVLDELDSESAESRPVGEWCDLLERTLGRLAGETSDDLATPLRELDSLRQAAATARGSAPADVSVPWHDLKTMLAARLAAPVGQQPLRTGVITATSLIPLRGVPFRVVCLAGYDDDAVAPQERDSEDLAERQQLLGDPDRGLEVRRQLLDCLLAAEDRLIITCTGMSVKNNEVLPLATPLAEFTDFAARHGVPPLQQNGKTFSGIEVIHPRHACSRKNFIAGADGVLGTEEPFSHDAAALATAHSLGQPAAPAVVAIVDEAQDTDQQHEVIQLDWLAEFMNDPLWPYVRKTLGINTWRDDDLSIPATLPLALATLEKRNLQDDYLERLTETGNQQAFSVSWQQAVRANGEVPVLGYGDAAIREITEFSAELLQLAIAEQVPLNQRHPKDVTLSLSGITVAGTIERCYPDAEHVEAVVLVRPDAKKSGSREFLRTKMLAVVQLLAARASGCDVAEAIVLNQHEKWYPGAVKTLERGVVPQEAAQKRTIILDDWIDQAQARALLTELCHLYQRAAVTPFGTFGKTSQLLISDRADAEAKFNAFTSGKDFTRSLELVVYGSAPGFSDVFPDDATVNAFYTRFHGLTNIKSNSQYRYIPDAPQS